MMRTRLGLLVLMLTGCAQLPQPARLPVMGLGDEEPRGGTAVEDSSLFRGPAREVGATPDSGGALSQSLLLLPFRNASEYKGPWNVSVRVPEALAAALDSNEFLRPLLLDSVRAGLNRREWKGKITLDRGLALAEEAGADYVVFGQIDGLSMQRFRATVPQGGYRSYEGYTHITLRPLKVISQEPLGDVSREASEKTKQYGITNPAAYIPYEKEYFVLGQMQWGSEEFHKTLVGESVDQCVARLAAALDSLIRPPPELRASRPVTIDLEDDQAYINVGLADSVSTGDKFGVWDKGRVLTDPNTGIVLGHALPRRVGVVQVEQVLSEHLSLVRILEGRERVRKEYAIRAE